MYDDEAEVTSESPAAVPNGSNPTSARHSGTTTSSSNASDQRAEVSAGINMYLLLQDQGSGSL